MKPLSETNSTKKPFGFLILDKPPGLTSHDCVQRVRRIFGIKRVGHAGTLDPSVTGVLPIALGNATRLIPYLEGTKTYLGIIKLGQKTSTDDLQGEILKINALPELSSTDLDQYLNQFRGSIKQRPPQVSSININGERAYKRHRKGEEIIMPYKQVKIHDLKLLKWDLSKGELEISIDCSSGTYIRSIARDLGEAIGCGGCLSELRRIQALGFTVDQAINIPDKLEKTNEILNSIKNPINALNHLPNITLINNKELEYWQTGRTIELEKERVKDFYSSHLDQLNITVLLEDEVVGIGEWYCNLSILKPKVVLNSRG
tara:strand:- start:307 stop:1254 length:948 start_codon:yes stop_codon:yes gene_type:complete